MYGLDAFTGKSATDPSLIAYSIALDPMVHAVHPDTFLVDNLLAPSRTVLVLRLVYEVSVCLTCSSYIEVTYWHASQCVDAPHP
jgi:hypothetical protein